MTISLSTNVSRKDIEYGEITDATTSLAPGKYTIGELTGPLEITKHSMGNRSSVYIVDPLGSIMYAPERVIKQEPI